MERETRVVALQLEHGEVWTFFPEEQLYAISRDVSLAELTRAVAEMNVHAQMVGAASAA